MAKPLERQRALRMRKNGKSIKFIARYLKVSSSTVSRWCCDVVLTREQIETLEIQSKDPNYGRRLEYALKQKELRRQKTERLLNVGIGDVGKLNRRELFLVGASLYWAEGFKKENQVGFGSSDPYMIKIFIKWLKECFGYADNQLGFRVTSNISHKYRIEEITDYWSKFLGLDRDLFQKPFYQNVKWKKEYDNPENYYGVLRVRVRKSSDFMKRIHGYIEGLKGNS